MLKLVSILTVCINFALVGCNKQRTPADGAVTTQSAEGFKTPSATKMLPLEEPLVVDVNSKAEISGVIRSVFQDSKGILWIGGECDLFRNDGTTLTSYAIKDDQGRGVTIKKIVEGKEIWCIHEGPSGNMWFSAKRSPVYRYDGNTFTKLKEQEEITSLAFTILEDSRGRLWLGGTHGLFRHDGNAFVQVTMNGPWQ